MSPKKAAFVIKDEIIMRKEILKASKDPLFLADIHRIEEDFKHADFEYHLLF